MECLSLTLSHSHTLILTLSHSHTLTLDKVAKRMELNHKIASIPPHITEKHQRIAYLESVLAKIVTAERVNPNL